MTAGLLRLLRRVGFVLVLLWSVPVGLAMLWTYAVTNNGGPIWGHPAFLDWIGIELALIATFVAVAALSRHCERR